MLNLLYKFYHILISPALLLLSATFMSCKFHPTCSCYAKDAIHVHGYLKGSFLALVRFLKCGPFTHGGYDPVPPKYEKCNDEKRDKNV